LSRSGVGQDRTLGTLADGGQDGYALTVAPQLYMVNRPSIPHDSGQVVTAVCVFALHFPQIYHAHFCSKNHERPPLVHI